MTYFVFLLTSCTVRRTGVFYEYLAPDLRQRTDIFLQDSVINEQTDHLYYCKQSAPPITVRNFKGVTNTLPGFRDIKTLNIIFYLLYKRSFNYLCNQ